MIWTNRSDTIYRILYLVFFLSLAYYYKRKRQNQPYVNFNSTLGIGINTGDLLPMSSPCIHKYNYWLFSLFAYFCKYLCLFINIVFVFISDWYLNLCSRIGILLEYYLCRYLNHSPQFQIKPIGIKWVISNFNSSKLLNFQDFLIWFLMYLKFKQSNRRISLRKAT